jgi:hypothetical protein
LTTTGASLFCPPRLLGNQCRIRRSLAPALDFKRGDGENEKNKKSWVKSITIGDKVVF